MLIPRFVVSIFSVGLMVVDAGVASGQDYPNKPIRIVTLAAGGGADFTARQVAQGISGPLGQPVIVDNRGSGVLAPEIVYKAPPDGYTLLVAGANLWTYTLMQKAPYDAVRNFSPISLIERTVNVFVVHPSVAAKSITELIALAKAKPGELNYGSSGVGGTSHLSVELFKSMAGINLVHVPYKGTAPAITALVGGEVQLAILDAGLVAPHLKLGRLRGLAVTSAEPSALAPGLPTVAASGLPGYEAGGVNCIFAPAKTPAAIINQLNQEIVRLLGRADVKERFLSAGVETVGSSPEELANKIRSEIVRMGKVIKDAGIKID
jgi:tripartite-type tricarboxylate transporter receptor subunit TctC